MILSAKNTESKNTFTIINTVPSYLKIRLAKDSVGHS